MIPPMKKFADDMQLYLSTNPNINSIGCSIDTFATHSLIIFFIFVYSWLVIKICLCTDRLWVQPAHSPPVLFNF